MSDEKKAKGEKKRSKKKLIVLPVIVLLVAGVGYKMFLAPKPKTPKPKVEGEVVALEKEFIVNLKDNHYGKVSVALVVEGLAAGKEGSKVVLPQEPIIRAIVTDELTGLPPDELTDREKRKQVLGRILSDLEKETDTKVKEVVFTDLAVQ